MSNASHPLSLSWTCSFLKNHRCMMYYVCFLPLRLCMMFPSSLTLWTTVVIITFVVKLSKETKQRTSKMTLSIWQEKIETKWLENYSPKMCLTPLKISGLVFSILIPWRDICCHGPSQQLTENAKHHPNSLRDQLLFWMDKRSFKNLFFTFRSRVVNSGYCKDVRESLELKGR